MAGNRYRNLAGLTVGLLTVIEPIEKSGGSNKPKRWLCKCECGNYCEVEAGHLTSKNRPIKSCGCLKGTKCSTNMIDMTGEKYGLLTVLNRVEERAKKGRHVKWICSCECGNTTIVDASDLRKHHIISCGCKRLSSGEIKVRDCLLQNGISFMMQYVITELTTKNNGNPRIDFAITDNDKNIIAFIEYQGLQHYKDCGIFGKQAREETDEMKRSYCKDRNIQLFEIKYNENVNESVAKILSDLMLIPCQASNEEGVTTIP